MAESMVSTVVLVLLRSLKYLQCWMHISLNQNYLTDFTGYMIYYIINKYYSWVKKALINLDLLCLELKLTHANKLYYHFVTVYHLRYCFISSKFIFQDVCFCLFMCNCEMLRGISIITKTKVNIAIKSQLLTVDVSCFYSNHTRSQ